MRQIHLANNLTVLVDDADYELVSRYRWYPSGGRPGDTRYAIASSESPNQRKQLRMHRLILGLGPNDPQVDHKNGNGLDNRRENLRLANHAQNGANSKLRRRKSLTGFRGVTKLSDAYQVFVAGKYVGRYATAEEAARAYDIAALERWGEFAKLNFPGATFTPKRRPSATERPRNSKGLFVAYA